MEKDYEPQAIASFSGVIAVDEVYDKEFCLFFATDPLNKKPISFHLCKSGTAVELEKFLRHLKQMGLNPEVIVVDGAPLYSLVPDDVWPGIRTQLCNFHVVRNCQNHVQDAIRTYYKSLPTSYKHVPGFKPPEFWVNAMRQKVKDRRLIHKNRYAFTTRPDNLSSEHQKVLKELCDRHPTLQTIHRFRHDLWGLFDRNQTKEISWAKLGRMKNDQEYLKLGHLQRALRRLPEEKFGKMITFLDYENLVATSNHVERTNRWFRKRQKTHYRNRKERTIRNMLKADLERWDSTPLQPEKLVKRSGISLKRLKAA